MMSMEASTKIITFTTPRARLPDELEHGHFGHIMKLYHFFEDLLYSCSPCGESECILVLNREAFHTEL